MKRLLLLSAIFTYFGWFNAVAQSDCGDPDVYCMNGGSITTCSGTLLDAGGAGEASGITTMLLFPETQGQRISLEFTAFDLGGPLEATLYVYDGINTNAPLIDSYHGTELEGATLSSGDDNAYGTLFLRLVVVNGEIVPGFEAVISCSAGCDFGSATVSYDNSIYTDDGLPLYCAPGAVQFDASASVAPEGFEIDSYSFAFGDGSTYSQVSPVYTHQYLHGGVFLPQLIIHASNGCSGLFNAPALVVSNAPSFSFSDELLICAGYGGYMNMEIGLETAVLNASVSNPEVIFLTDDAGVTYSSPIQVTGFPEGMVLSDCSEIAGISLKIEHSYGNDLRMELKCSNGNSATLLEWPNALSGSFLGEPNDDESDDPGTGYEYHFVVPGSGFPTMSEFVTANPGINPVPAGTYEFVDCELEGCPLNGAWSLDITDNLVLDNGYLFGWSLDYNLDLGEDELLYEPIYGPGADSSFWSGDGILWLSEDADSIQLDFSVPAVHSLNYTLITHDGCEYNEAIEVTIDDFQISVDAGEDVVYGEGNNILEGSILLSGNSVCVGELVDEFCYEGGFPQYFSYCSQDLFGCEDQILLLINSGEVENGWDQVYIYDGPDNSSPLIFNGTGDLSGMSFTGNSGCLTIEIIPDETMSSCTDVALDPFQVSVSAQEPYSFEWIPEEGLTEPESLVTGLDLFTAQSQYILHANVEGTLGCAASDTVNVVLPAAYINGFIFYDTNENGIYDVDESPIAYFPGIVNQNLDYTLSDVNGDIQLFAVGGTNTVTITSDTLMWTATTPTTYVIDVDYEGEPEPLQFGYVASPNASPVVEITANLDVNSCNLSSTHSVSIVNSSSVATSGYVAVTVPDFVNLLPEFMQEDSIVGNTLYFGFQNLNYLSQLHFEIVLQNPGVEFIGQWLEFTTQVYLFDEDNEAYSFHRENVEGYYLTCAYDPNDIQEHIGIGEEGFVEANTRLHYTIRFQNTGTAPATDVLVVDSLPDLLLPQSFQPSGHSHDYTLHIDPDGVASFFFENINLPDSTSDLDGSQGFVSFYIDQQPDLSAGTVWQNKAEIYFDLNPPIITNYAYNTIWDCESAELSWSEDVNEDFFTVLTAYPPSPNIVWYSDGTSVAHGPVLTDPFSLDYNNYIYPALELNEGCVIQSDEVWMWEGINEGNESSFYLYPNPATVGQLVILQADEGIIGYQITDLSGKLIEFQRVNNNTQIKTEGLSRGSYVVLIEYTDGSLGRAKLILQ